MNKTTRIPIRVKPSFETTLEQKAQRLENLISWMSDLLRTAHEVQKNLMRFYIPEKGWSPHIESLIPPTDYDAVLAEAKKMLDERQ